MKFYVKTITTEIQKIDEKITKIKDKMDYYSTQGYGYDVKKR